MPEATLSTGVTLRYAAQGDPAGVPVVLLHGLTDSHPSYAPMTAHLPDHIRAYALTTRGHGDSDKPEHGYRLEEQAADVAAFLDAVGHEAAVIVGHSMGSYIAQRFAIDHPERTVALVLMGAFRTIAGDPGLTEFRAELDAHRGPRARRELAREFQESTIARPLAPGQLEQAIAESCKVPVHVWRAAPRRPARRSGADRGRPDHGARPASCGATATLLPARRAAAPDGRRSPAPS